MRYIVILKVRTFPQTTANHFSTARQNPAGGLNRVKKEQKQLMWLKIETATTSTEL